jgi:DNA sulfur modification protein DndC
MNADQLSLPSFDADYLQFGGRYLSEIYNEIKQLYLTDNRPWVIGYSGGKDSTTALQLVWYALNTLPPKKLSKPIYIISSDTLVETPVVVDHIYNSLRTIKDRAEKLGLPFKAELVRPLINNSFWVNLIGKGYPIPYSRARWCTDRLKISPANRFILDKVAEFGEVILVLGVRKSESATRAQVISMRSVKGSLLKSHTSLPGAYVYAPIVDFSTQDVWDYLMECPSPWGNEETNKDLFNLYKNANSGECPLVIDNTTPSCGNSRFGCWVCTVVKRDHSMESLIESGEKWMAPLLKFRNSLSIIAEPKFKHLYRDHRRRDGKVYFKKVDYRDREKNIDNKSNQDQIAWGQTRIDKGLSPSAIKFLIGLGFEVKTSDIGLPQVLLRNILKIQLEIQRTHPNTTIISDQELMEIRNLWRNEQNDWADQVPKIYHEVTGGQLDWIEDDISSFTLVEKQTLEKICRKQNIPPGLVIELLDLERQYHGMSRRSDIYKKIDKIFNKEWRTVEEIVN